MRAVGASRVLSITSALILGIGVAACADRDASEPGELSGVEAAAPPERAEEPAEAPKEAAGETPGVGAAAPAEAGGQVAEETGPPAEKSEEEVSDAEKE